MKKIKIILFAIAIVIISSTIIFGQAFASELEPVIENQTQNMSNNMFDYLMGN